MPGKGVANFINPINANTCLFTWAHSWGRCGCVIDSRFSVPRAGLWHRSTAVKQAMSMPLNSLICQNWASSHSLPLGRGMLMPQLWPGILLRSVPWPWPAVLSENLVCECCRRRVPSAACWERDWTLHVLLHLWGKNKEEKDAAPPCPGSLQTRSHSSGSLLTLGTIMVKMCVVGWPFLFKITFPVFRVNNSQLLILRSVQFGQI